MGASSEGNKAGGIKGACNDVFREGRRIDGRAGSDWLKVRGGGPILPFCSRPWETLPDLYKESFIVSDLFPI